MENEARKNTLATWPAAPRVLAVLSCALALLAINPAMVSEILIRQLPASVLMTRRTLAASSIDNKVSRFGPVLKADRPSVSFLPPRIDRQQAYLRIHAALSPPVA